MPFAAKPADEQGAAWVQPGDLAEPIGSTAVTQAWLATASDEELADRALIRAEVSGAAPVPGLPHPPALDDVSGVPTWVWASDGEAAMRAARLSEIDDKAGAVILAAYPIWKQLNMTARATELLDIASQRALTGAEAAERTALRSAWAWVDSVRAHSNTLKSALPATGSGIAAFDIDGGWPT